MNGRRANNGLLTAKQEAMVNVPLRFFAKLMPQIDDLAELKATLYFLAAIQQKEGDYRFMRLEEFQADADLMAGLALSDKSMRPAEILNCALDKALERGTLLVADVTIGEAKRRYFLLNDEGGIALQRRLRAGEWRPAAADEIELLPARPTLYGLYEENIGVLTPMIAEAINEAEASYPRAWIEDAMRYAVERNARNWRYIRKVLEAWQQEGRSLETGGGDLEPHKQYRKGEWKDFIES